MNNKPFHAPLQNPKKILDIGCGTGAMTSLLASLYPEAQVIGVDIAAVQEGRHEQQSNLEYVQGDIRELVKSGVDPRFQQGSFDFVFNRLLLLGMVDWPGYISSVVSLLRPEGWLEIQEPSMSLWTAQGEKIQDSWEFWPAFKADMKAIGLDGEIGEKLADYFRETGKLEKVAESRYPFLPDADPERPELDGLSANIMSIFVVAVRKVCGDKRGEQEVNKMEQEIRSRWEKGFSKGDQFTMYVATGQKKAA